MQQKNMKSIDCTMSSESSAIPWRFEANWVVAHGSLHDSVTVEASDDPIDESGPENWGRKSPLILKPRGPDSGPCEIKISFEQKYEVGQIYVRSTARTYEVYCTHSPHSINEYLCTVRCGVAERDDKVLQTNCIEVVKEEHGEGALAEVIAETATDGGNIVTGEDDWIKIKVPEVGGGSASNKIATNEVNDIQDFYEATAQISDSDPCLSLTIRLLSLQDKGCVYVDEIYVFVDPVESTDSGNEAVIAGSSAQSSLMAMFMPTLMQLSKSGASRVQEKYASDELLKDAKTESRSTVIDKIDLHEQYIKPKELDEDTSESSEHQQHTSANKCVELDNDTAESSELQQNTSAKKCVEPKDKNDSLPGHIEIALEQLIGRLSRVEDICLRFEEKLLKPIESIEARLQQVENQLEKLAKNHHNLGLPHCTGISAPAFSCNGSNSCSFYNGQSDYPPHGASDLENKDFSCNKMPDLSHDANFQPGLVVGAPEFSCSESHDANFQPGLVISAPEFSCSESHDANFQPGLVVSAPEFSCGEGEDDNDDLNTMKDSPCVKPKKTLSVDDALAGALNGFLSTAATNPSEHIQTTLGLSSQVNEETQCWGHGESCQIKSQEFSAADNGNRESSRYALVLTVKAPDFTVEEAGNEDHSNYTPSSLDMASVTENEKRDHGDEIFHPSIQSKGLYASADLSDIGKNESTSESKSPSNGDSPAGSVKVSRTCPGNGHVNGSSEANVIDTYFEEETSSAPAGFSDDSAPDLTKDSVETCGHQISDETNSLVKSTSFNTDDQNNASEQVLGHESENVSEVLERFVAIGRCFKDDTPNSSKLSRASLLDFELPILEVKFTSDACMSTKSPLEALLDGAAKADTGATGNDDGNTNQVNAFIRNGKETTDLLPIDYFSVDEGVSAADGSSNLEDVSHYLCTPGSPEMNGLQPLQVGSNYQQLLLLFALCPS